MALLWAMQLTASLGRLHSFHAGIPPPMNLYCTIVPRKKLGVCNTFQKNYASWSETSHRKRALAAGFVHTQSHCRRKIGIHPECSSYTTLRCSSDSTDNNTKLQHPINNVAIIGGGLAGLSVAYHLLELRQTRYIDNQGASVAYNPLHITIYDKSKVGEGGASAVAGGLQHPFSPKGKLIHFGIEALEQSNRLVQSAMKHQPSCLIKPHLYRIALSEANVKQLQDAAINYPQIATWMSKEEMHDLLGAETMGGLKLGGGCQVIDVPLYLEGLWEACEAQANEFNGSISWEQREINGDCFNAQVFQNDHDVVILAAGAGIVHDKMLPDRDDGIILPIQLVRGQAIVMDLPRENNAALTNEALLCGKYVSPLQSIQRKNDNEQTEAEARQFVVGATHEFHSTKLDESQVIEELKNRSYPFVPHLWDRGVVKSIIAGVRMQSNRGKFGRMPIIGRPETSHENDKINKWIFAGLSSRGLIYHGLFSRWLADAVLRNDEKILHQHFEEFDWWKQKR
ncbi:hypothetical protein HJC23_007126 [Cyclotella cryptica]|uniref:FAD dependent oxidoreductase domain-containing protein n=1 Tax=Cyclotella cryptica TaxID=29204 RepID=A0ABD3NNP3_9STRA